MEACGTGEGLMDALPKSSRFAPPFETETVITAGSPVPVRVRVCGEPASAPFVLVYASVITIVVNSLVPVEVGVKVTPMKQLLPPLMVKFVVPQVLSGVILKSVLPGPVMDCTVNGTEAALRTKNLFSG